MIICFTAEVFLTRAQATGWQKWRLMCNSYIIRFSSLLQCVNNFSLWIFIIVCYKFCNYCKLRMKRIRQDRVKGESWHCALCNSFQALTLRILLRHYNSVHANEPNFQVVCSVEGCPAKFTLYNSFYKHILKKHNLAIL